VLDGDLELVGGLCEMAADAGDDLVKAKDAPVVARLLVDTGTCDDEAHLFRVLSIGLNLTSHFQCDFSAR
jgi:hypothetical protein